MKNSMKNVTTKFCDIKYFSKKNIQKSKKSFCIMLFNISTHKLYFELCNKKVAGFKTVFSKNNI